MVRASSKRAPAHPRVSGENGQPIANVIITVGSSPRERGKPATASFEVPLGGLIPA